MSEARRLQFSLLASLLINSAALLAAGWFWHFQPLPASAPRPRIKLVKVALLPKPPVPKPILTVKPVPPPVPKPHRIKPRPVTQRRPGARVKSSSPAPPAKAAGGSDAGAAGPQMAAAPPMHVIARKQPAPFLVHNQPALLPPQISALDSDSISVPTPSPTASTAPSGQGASGAGTSGGGKGAGEGGGNGSGMGPGSGQDAGEPFDLGTGLAGDGGPRHVVYVLDISGSMTSRIKRADSEIRKTLDGLRPDETFDIIAFNDNVHPFDTELAPATPGMVQRASDFLDTLYVNNGTNLEDAMTAALSIPNVNEVVLLTDGVPTQGEQDFGKLARLIRRRNQTHARISTVGMVGKNPDGTDDTFEATHLLQQIAADSGGACEIVPLGVASP